MNILFLNPVGTIGGAERVLLTAIAGMLAADTEDRIHLITLADGPLVTEARALGVTVQVLPLPNSLSSLGDSELRSGKILGGLRLLRKILFALPSLLHFRQNLRKAVRQIAPEILYSNGIKTHLLCAIAIPKSYPIVWHVHDFYSLRPAAARILRMLSGRTRVAIAISKAVAADTERVLPGVPVQIVRNCVDSRRFSPTGPVDDLDALAGMAPAPPGTVRVGLVATYAKWKGHAAFLEAIARLASGSASLPARFYIVGGPIYATKAQHTQAELQAIATSLGIRDRVAFVPFRDTAAVFRALNVAVHASTLPEPFGLTVIEAMSCGRAVIVSAAGGAAELFTDGQDALGVSPGDILALAAAIRRLVTDAELRTRLGSNARATVETQFDQKGYGPQLREALRTLIR